MIKETIAQIQRRLIAAKEGTLVLHDPTNIDPDKRGLTSTSSVAFWRMILNLIATEQAAFEDVLEIFEQDVEALIKAAPAGSPAWLQQKCLEFQYSATVPQIIQLVNFAPVYPIINTALRIITQAAVVSDPQGGYVVKVAANLTPLSTPQQNALASYLNHINFGVPYIIISAEADALMIGADILYDGQYNPTIQQSVTDAINAYRASFNTNNFNGKIILSKIEDVIQAVPGVVDVILRQVEVTPVPSTTPPPIVMVNNSQELISEYSAYAGHFAIDTGAGRTLADTLNFIIQ